MKLILIIATLLSASAYSSDQFCEEQSVESLREEYCKNPIEVICNGNSERTNEGRSTFVEAYNYGLEVVNKESARWFENYFRRNGYPHRYYSNTSIDFEELDSCSAEGEEQVCDPLHWYQINQPQDYYAHNGKGNAEWHFNYQLSPKLRLAYSNILKDYFSTQLKHEDDIKEVVKSIIPKVIEAYAQKVRDSGVLEKSEAERKIQKMKTDFEHFTINLSPVSYSVEPNSEEFRKNSYFRLCGIDGLLMNASVTTGILTEVNICLGLLKDTGVLQASEVTDEIYWKLYDRLFFIISHEMGHRFSLISRDNNPVSKTYNQPKLLRPYLVCLMQNYKMKPEMWANFKNYVFEISADAAAVEAFSAELSDPEMSLRQKIKLIRSSFAPFCQAREHAEGDRHPPVNFRIKEILYKNPAVFKAMGCEKFTKSKRIVGCNLKGESIISFGLGVLEGK